jgi:hypothetical protein
MKIISKNALIRDINGCWCIKSTCIKHKTNFGYHGLWNNGNVYVGYHYKNKCKGFWLLEYKE